VEFTLLHTRGFAAAGFPLLPSGYLDRLSPLLAHPGQTPAELANSVSALESLWCAVIAISGDEYRSRYEI
jgi:hypothetical protein